MLKEVLRQLHSGVPAAELKEKFKKVLENTSSEDIAKIEQELVSEGMPREELQRLCDVHLLVFGDQLQGQRQQAPIGHPINILMEEHKIMTQHAERLGTITAIVEEANESADLQETISEMQQIIEDFVDSEKHYLREENVLFPTLEKHGITEPPAIMWMEHDKIREKKRQLKSLSEKWKSMNFADFKAELKASTEPLCQLLSSHFFKENNILFPTAMQVFSEQEWQDVRKEFDEIGYCCFTPPEAITVSQTMTQALQLSGTLQGLLQFENGSLSTDEIEAILDTLPIDISFVDKNDAVKYFNKAEKRIFVRTKAVLGRKVQMCHPQKSIHIVNQIVEAFKTGKKDTAEFWINMNDRLVYIRYLAVRDKNHDYLGTVEVTQDLTDIKKIEGQKRLLDWQA